MIPLQANNLEKIAATGVEIPRYQRNLEHRICHIGVGGFHRAHQAVYLHRLLQKGKAKGWGICGIGLMPADKTMHDMLHRQDFLYSVWALGKTSREVTIVGAIMDHLDASTDPAAAIELLADTATKIVSLTITEKGYCLTKNGELDTTNPAIVADLQSPDHPSSAIGVITKALALRKEKNLTPFTVMSCDNLLENGHQARNAIVAYAKLIDAQLSNWIDQLVAFPLSMVDRITPAPQKARIDRLCEEWGVKDDGLLVCEDWLQWVLEDNFTDGRPEFEMADVQMTKHVKPYEDMKVGLLNGSHSALSYYGLLKGHVRVDEAVSDPAIQSWLRSYMKQIEATLEPIAGVDFDDYENALITRFSNPNIEDRLIRLAEDGSQKFQQALLPSLIKSLNSGGDIRLLESAIANWVCYLAMLKNNAGIAEQYKDPMKDELIELADNGLVTSNLQPFTQRALGLRGTHAEAFAKELLRHAQGMRQHGIDSYNESVRA